MLKAHLRLLVTFAIMVFAIVKVNSQVTMPAELNKSTLKEQLIYLEGHTRIYQDYRAIREDMFQKIKGNVTDTLTVSQIKIAGLISTASSLNLKIDSLNGALETTKSDLAGMTRTKNSIKVMGIEVNKGTYNSLMWTIIAVLTALLVFGLLAFKRNLVVTGNAKTELQELKNEFEVYRKTTREAREKATMEHFLEIKKLKGG